MNEDSYSARVGDDWEELVASDPLVVSVDGSRAEGSPIVGAFLTSGRDHLSSCAPADSVGNLVFGQHARHLPTSADFGDADPSLGETVSVQNVLAKGRIVDVIAR